tara:strand:- start:136 stop:504 length:369 start_codon:yes stop_codon:yes gene_type:complete
LSKSRYKVGDIVLVKSCAGDVIPNIHVKLIERVIVKPTPPKRVGFKMSMEWPGFSGWNAEIVFQEEADLLRKEWSIPFSGPGDRTFVYDSSIIKKPRKIKIENLNNTIRKERTIIRRRKIKK